MRFIIHGPPTAPWCLHVTHSQGFSCPWLQIFPFIQGQVINSVEMYAITFRDMWPTYNTMVSACDSEARVFMSLVIDYL